ncbi:bifunctional putative acetyl-CoA:acetoacetyl-CoA transferase: alpha subunit/beta subunit [Klebsiella pneumoniae]|uniref:Bifunctional putative acetyl-CoA:acetoacetyl-CoA transferase: alpha subunit/beta subunit n=1 Tax=Klebsiella pneumoniae TaxID=573 RepID=A0A378B9L4_KLEPN|nr:bifunctional putative acetyl-CoA:acetoacetyl-CoA transferase: alpha subunit/beta subunit [Klebsiella pneumoniae]STV90878.1 bifunctional putative acetyl-CoA:acetoacetyl-CoA transferase: alpha subunit/beta subunit [Klebsiella pneumoniae]
MNAEQTTGRVWNRRRTEKQRRLAEANMPGKVIPTDQLVSVLENLLAPGDRVVLEGNNQKQADFLSRMLAEVNPQKNPRPAYDYAQRRAQRASGPV